VGPPLTPAPQNPPAPTANAVYQPQVNVPQLPPGCPPVALDGNCPVTLMERKRWAVGHTSFGAVHRGRTYLFLGPQERDKFLADPDRFSPVLSGLDPVHALDHQQSIPGKREYGVFGADGKIYLFADEASRAKFEQNEQHYTAAAGQALGQPTYQAMRPTP
jgi:YHS domain-containing protein